jgi:hypothetical protein
MLFFPRPRLPMKLHLPLALLGLLVPALSKPQETPKPKKKSDNLVTRFFEEEGERLAQEVEGSWMLFEYLDPHQPPLDDAASGFVTFHEGFLTWMVAVDTVEERLFAAREHLILEAGAYRYRFDEQANLQVSGVMVFTNDTDDGELERMRPGFAFEYIATLDADVLELRNAQGVQLSFRRVHAGEFPASAARELEGRRGGVDSWKDPAQDPGPR